MTATLKEKVILITGASSGIGRDTAILAAREGARVVLAARRLDRLEQTVNEIHAAGGQALAVQADISRPDDVQRLIDKAIQHYGRIDVLINNAAYGLYARFEETTTEAMERIWRTNFFGTFDAIAKVLPHMKPQGSGHIITISSVAGRRAIPLNAAYCSTKFALSGLMESLRMEMQNTGIHFTLVYPGSTQTEFHSALENPGQRSLKHHGPVQSSREVAKAIIKVIKKPTAEVITMKYGRILVVLNALSPGFVDWIISRTVKRKVVREL